VARSVAAQALGQSLECRERCERSVNVVVGQVVEMCGEACAALRADALVQRDAGRSGSARAARRSSAPGSRLIRRASASRPAMRSIVRVDALDLRELGQSQRAAPRDRGEDRELGGGEALAGLGRPQVTCGDCERHAQPLDRFLLDLRLRRHLSPILAC
jgi:hypothetical protein